MSDLKDAPVETLAAPSYNELTHIDDAVPLSEADASCLQEVRAVLLRHGKIDRFGLALLHKHFALDSDEILVEECDEDARVLTTRPRRVSEIPADAAVGTIWSLRGFAAQGCYSYCVPIYKPDGRMMHNTIHKDPDRTD